MRLQDALSKQKITLNQSTITIYCCGPTVYGPTHIGNVRPIIMVDLIIRTLRFQGYKVNYLHNITDLDDKIILQAQKKKMTEQAYSQPLVRAYYQDLELLNTLAPTKILLVSQHITAQIKFIQQLLTQQAAYQVGDEIFFDVSQYINRKGLNYYQLSGFSPHQTQKRIPSVTSKRNDLDFFLWKKTHTGIQFSAPWGRGRPGWHTECATLIDWYFQSQTIDLHVGGIDLKFPHHENERIQYIAKNGCELARIWFYVGQLQAKNQKMSKSIGNVILLRKFLNSYSANVLRYLFYTANPQAPLQITDQMIHEAQLFEKNLFKYSQLLVQTPKHLINHSQLQFVPLVVTALNDNLNSRQVIAIIYQLFKAVRRCVSQSKLLTNLAHEFKLICYQVCGFRPPFAR